MFHIQATPAFHLEIIIRVEAMAYKPILQAALKYKLCGVLPGFTELSRELCARYLSSAFPTLKVLQYFMIPSYSDRSGHSQIIWMLLVML